MINLKKVHLVQKEEQEVLKEGVLDVEGRFLSRTKLY